MCWDKEILVDDLGPDTSLEKVSYHNNQPFIGLALFIFPPVSLAPQFVATNHLHNGRLALDQLTGDKNIYQLSFYDYKII